MILFVCKRLCFLVTIFFAVTASAQQQWHSFFDGAAFGTYVTETGPTKPETRAFSTNWFIVGTGRPVQIYLAPVGEPPLGAEPFAQRSSSLDFAEAPFAYDVQESFHIATRVAAAALTSHFADVEYGVFHASNTTGRHTTIDDGNIDSWSARLTIAPDSKLSAQVSTGRLTDAKRKVDSASITYRGPVLATSAIWTKRDDRKAYGFEATIRYFRSNVMGRVETIDRRTHTTVGYIFDVFRARTQRAGIGIDIDYHSNTRAIEKIYGHKPQTIYTFVRWRTEGITRPASP